MTRMNPKLVADLARLAARYSPEDWRTLSRLLQDEESRALVTTVIDELAKASRRARKPTTRPPTATARPTTRDRLEELRETDSQRAELLDDLWAKLRRRELLADMASVRAFSEAVGMKALSARRREQAVSEIIRYLSTLPQEVLETALARTTLQADRELGQEYEQWVSLILNRERP